MFLTLNVTPPSSSGVVAISATTPIGLSGNLIEGQHIELEATGHSGFTVSTAPAGTGYDPEAHEIYHVWTVRGSPLSAYTAPENMVSGWNNANLAYGKKVKFYFPDAGSFTVDLWCIDKNGVTGVAEHSFTVLSADSQFPTTQTICYSNDGSETWVGEKTGCQRITSWSALETALSAAASPIRVLFKRGQSIDIRSQSRILINSTGKYWNYLDEWGSPGDPAAELLTPRKNSMLALLGPSNSVDWFVHRNVNLTGEWNPVSESGYPTSNPYEMNSMPVDGFFFSLSDCTIKGYSSFSFQCSLTVATNMCFANTIVTDWRDYGFFSLGNATNYHSVAFIGCRIAQNVWARNGGDKNGLFNTHGQIRHKHSPFTYVAVCDLFNRCGWSAASPERADQGIRHNHDGYRDQVVIHDRNVIEGGHIMVALSGQNGSTPERPGTYLFDRVLLIATSKTYRCGFLVEYGGSTFRNIVYVRANVPTAHGQPYLGMVGFDLTAAPQTGNLTSPCRIESCTLVGLMNDANNVNGTWVTHTNPDGFAVTTADNVVHAPNLTSAIEGDAPIDNTTTFSGITPRYAGTEYSSLDGSQVLGSSVANGASVTFSYPSGTNQAYWQARESAGSVGHGVATQTAAQVGGSTYTEAWSLAGDISVSFGVSNITVTNTSGVTWGSGGDCFLRLDRRDVLGAPDSTEANPSTVPLPRPLTGSAARDSAANVWPPEDFLLNDRATPAERGALEAV